MHSSQYFSMPTLSKQHLKLYFIEITNFKNFAVSALQPFINMEIYLSNQNNIIKNALSVKRAFKNKGVIYMILLVWCIFGLFLNTYAAYEYGDSIQYRISLFLFPLGWIALAYYVWLKLHETTNL